MTPPLTDLSTLPAPPEIIAALSTYRDALVKAATPHLQSLILYGGLARNRYRPNRSDINICLVSRDDSQPYLDAIAPILRDAFRHIRLEPFLLTLAELPSAAQAFPTKILDIQRRHILLHGPDSFLNLTVNPSDVARRIEQELRNLAMRLRRRYIAAADDDRAVRDILDEAAVTLRINFLALADLATDPAPVTDADDLSSESVFGRAADRYALDRRALSHLASIRAGRAIDDEPSVRDLLATVISTISRVADIAANLGVTP